MFAVLAASSTVLNLLISLKGSLLRVSLLKLHTLMTRSQAVFPFGTAPSATPAAPTTHTHKRCVKQQMSAVEAGSKEEEQEEQDAMLHVHVLLCSQANSRALTWDLLRAHALQHN